MLPSPGNCVPRFEGGRQQGSWIPPLATWATRRISTATLHDLYTCEKPSVNLYYKSCRQRTAPFRTVGAVQGPHEDTSACSRHLTVPSPSVASSFFGVAIVKTGGGGIQDHGRRKGSGRAQRRQHQYSQRAPPFTLVGRTANDSRRSNFGAKHPHRENLVQHFLLLHLRGGNGCERPARYPIERQLFSNWGTIWRRHELHLLLHRWKDDGYFQAMCCCSCCCKMLLSPLRLDVNSAFLISVACARGSVEKQARTCTGS